MHYLPQLPSTNPASAPAVPPPSAQHDTLPPAADSAFPPNSSFRFGSFSPEEVGKAAGAASVHLPVLSQPPGEEHPDLRFGEVVSLAQLEQAPPVPRRMTEPMPPPGPPPGPPPFGQSAPTSFPAPRTAAGQAQAARPSALKLHEPHGSSVPRSSAAVERATAGAETIPDAVSASMHASTELPASQGSSSMPVSPPLPGRGESTPSTGSPGQFNQEGMRLPLLCERSPGSPLETNVPERQRLSLHVPVLWPETLGDISVVITCFLPSLH